MGLQWWMANFYYGNSWFILSPAKWRSMRQYEGEHFAFGDWQDLNIGNNTLNISEVNYPRQIGFQIEGNVTLLA